MSIKGGSDWKCGVNWCNNPVGPIGKNQPEICNNKIWQIDRNEVVFAFKNKNSGMIFLIVPCFTLYGIAEHQTKVNLFLAGFRNLVPLCNSSAQSLTFAA